MRDAKSAQAFPNFSFAHGVERERLGLSTDLKEIDGIGLALSGGGIRSASFALGAVQVLLNEGALSKIDYLSTVSGGGYLGSAISWWLHEAATDQDFVPIDQIKDRYEAFRQQFGSKVIGARTRIGTQGPSKSPWGGSNWLAYIRQHGNYLQPRGVGIASLAASVLRVCLYPLFIYGIALTGIFSWVMSLETWSGIPLLLEYTGLVVAFLPLMLLVLMSWAYGPATWFASRFGAGASTWLYRRRTAFRHYSATLLSCVPAGLLIAGVPWAYCALPGVKTRAATWLSSLTIGSIGAVYQFFRGRAQSKSPSWAGRIRLIATSGLVIFGLLLASYAAAALSPCHGLTGLFALAFAGIFGLFVNTNYAGLARLYRDRLMEAFLPDIRGMAANKWTLATRANVQEVSKLRGRLKCGDDLVTTDATNCQRPLQLVNCNVVLMDSSNDMFRNRGGDSFIISQLWSGSNATGWLSTEGLGDGEMTLATAMSISGAAANPNAGPNGLGVTRNRLVSFLMSLFNVRLGFWLSNPKIARAHPSNKPNFWFPGFRQGLLGSGLSETAGFLELTDGGHFDNTAIYELIRRRTKLIIVAQAGCDPAYTMEDLANAIEKVRVDFSVFIEFDDMDLSLEALRALSDKPFEPCKRGYAVGRIRYPKGTPTSPDFDDGVIVYLQAVPATLPADVVSYWRRHLEFPNDTTADQFFTEENLEAYRELGYAITSQFYKDLKSHDDQRRTQPQLTDPSPSLTQIATVLLK
ncbi:MAG TPA: patatin-like phospholipase family protein [Steroidobacteraceae bacterium]|nr:patatin-like phospholipase family protein [Steroidobacteraceae bacterium]